MIITRCPACLTAFRVSPEQLSQRDGRVRCGHCYRPFDARANRIADDALDEPPCPSVIHSRRPQGVAPAAAEATAGEPLARPYPAAETDLPAPHFEATTPDEDAQPGTPEDFEPLSDTHWHQAREADTAEHEQPYDHTDDASSASMRWDDASDEDPEPEDAPSVDAWREQAYAPAAAPVRHRWLWALCVGILLGILGAQASYIWREPITRQWPQLRPLYLEACVRLGCSVPLPRIAGQLAIEHSNMEFSAPGSAFYELHGVLHNRAPHPQQVPHMELTLSDTNDQPLMRRALAPAEWLPEDFDIEAGIPADARIEFTLPFSAPKLQGVTGFRVVAFYP